MNIKTTIPDCAFEHDMSQPDAGTHSRGKSNDEEATLRKGALPKGTAVTDAQCVAGAARKALDQQMGTNDPVNNVSGIAGNGMRGN